MTLEDKPSINRLPIVITDPFFGAVGLGVHTAKSPVGRDTYVPKRIVRTGIRHERDRSKLVRNGIVAGHEILSVQGEHHPLFFVFLPNGNPVAIKSARLPL